MLHLWMLSSCVYWWSQWNCSHELSQWSSNCEVWRNVQGARRGWTSPLRGAGTERHPALLWPISTPAPTVPLVASAYGCQVTRSNWPPPPEGGKSSSCCWSMEEHSAMALVERSLLRPAPLTPPPLECSSPIPILSHTPHLGTSELSAQQCNSQTYCLFLCGKYKWLIKKILSSNVAEILIEVNGIFWLQQG